jgi:hypothetical protein
MKIYRLSLLYKWCFCETRSERECWSLRVEICTRPTDRDRQASRTRDRQTSQTVTDRIKNHYRQAETKITDRDRQISQTVADKHHRPWPPCITDRDRQGQGSKFKGHTVRTIIEWHRPWPTGSKVKDHTVRTIIECPKPWPTCISNPDRQQESITDRDWQAKTSITDRDRPGQN